MTGITIYNVKRAVSPKASNSELWFLCSADHIMVIYICIKFQENISNSFQVTEWTHYFQCEVLSKYLQPFPTYRADTSTWQKWPFFQYLLCSKGGNSKSRLTRVMVLVFCMLSHGALHFRDTYFMKIFQTVFSLQSRQ